MPSLPKLVILPLIPREFVKVLYVSMYLLYNKFNTLTKCYPDFYFLLARSLGAWLYGCSCSGGLLFGLTVTISRTQVSESYREVLQRIWYTA